MPQDRSPDRFVELAELLESYAGADFTFSDTAEVPGPGLASYLRIVARTPSRAVAAVREIDDLLAVGLFAEEVADDVARLPQVRPPSGKSVEDCLRVARIHLSRLIGNPTGVPAANPRSRWEWEQRFPALGLLLAAYFNQDLPEEYGSGDAALHAYVDEHTAEERAQAAREIGELLAAVGSDQELGAGTSALGLEVSPPRGSSLRQWLGTVRDRIAP